MLRAMHKPVHTRSSALLTRADYQQHRDQLEELRRIRDRDLPELLRDARGFVASDAEEEIAQIRDDHVYVEARIAHLEAVLREAQVIADDDAPGIAFPGRDIEVQYLRTGRRAAYRIAGAGSPSGPRTMSPGSPMGQAVIGRAVGDVVSVELPGGSAEQVRIVSVEARDDGLAAA
jgi:transcription elongation factor GreA